MNAPQKPATPKKAQRFFRELLDAIDVGDSRPPCKRPGNKCLPSNPRPDGTRICLWCGEERK